MEDILALLLVLSIFGLFVWVVNMIRLRVKRHQIKQRIQEEADRVRYSPKQWAPMTPSMAKPKPETKKRPPAMKKANKTNSYANIPMTSSTSTAAVADDGFFSGVATGMLIDEVVKSMTHKSGGSDPIDFPKVSSTPSWGLDDSDSRKSISDSMDSSSSWSSSDSSSSDSGPSSDW